MRTVTIADLRRNFADVSRWIEQGERVHITRHGRPFATLIPSPEAKQAEPWPDLKARRGKIFPHPVKGTTSEKIVDYLRGEY